MNHSRRHTYYVKRTCDWLRLQGTLIEHVHNPIITEISYTVLQGDRHVYVKKDLWGSDIIFTARIGFNTFLPGLHALQVKTSDRPATIRLGKRQLLDSPWPPDVGLHVIYWPKGKRLKDGPTIINAHS